MKFEQVIQAIRNGKQVKVADFDPIEVSKWTGEQSICLKLLLSNDWQIVPEYVSFDVAWKAYEEGRVIQAAQTGNKKKKLPGLVQMFDEFEIRNKWLILEDE